MPSKLLGFICAAMLFTGVCATPAVAQDTSVVHTDRGPVRSAAHGNLLSFQGIPYAAPPVGERRWRSPQPAARWHEPRDGGKVPPACPQVGDTSSTEDCLYLNVTTPARPHHRLPVMVWLHGGSYTSGSGALYDPRKLVAEGDVIVVTVNYRLGVLGFLGSPLLDGETGSYGLEDQQAALRWVRRNAAAFGGDPGNVTLFGQSAGAASVCAHLASPGLFDRAIAQSFSCTTSATTRPEAEQVAAQVATTVGCTDAACLRGKPVADLLQAWPWPGGGPVVGGRVLPVQPAEALRRNTIPLMLGNNRDEMRTFVAYEHGATLTPAKYEEIIRADYGAKAEQVLRTYPVTAYPSASIALSTVRSDVDTCNHLRSYSLSRKPVYAYQFADRTAPPMYDLPDFDEGATHSSELSYLFTGFMGLSLNAEQRKLSTTMTGYWTNFARTGNPNAPGSPAWPRFHASDNVLSLDLGTNTRPVDVAKTSNCGTF